MKTCTESSILSVFFTFILIVKIGLYQHFVNAIFNSELSLELKKTKFYVMKPKLKVKC